MCHTATRMCKSNISWWHAWILLWYTSIFFLNWQQHFLLNVIYLKSHIKASRVLVSYCSTLYNVTVSGKISFSHTSKDTNLASMLGSIFLFSLLSLFEYSISIHLVGYFDFSISRKARRFKQSICVVWWDAF